MRRDIYPARRTIRKISLVAMQPDGIINVIKFVIAISLSKRSRLFWQGHSQVCTRKIICPNLHLRKILCVSMASSL